MSVLPGDVVTFNVEARIWNPGEQFEVQQVFPTRINFKSLDDGHWVKLDRGQAARYVQAVDA